MNPQLQTLGQRIQQLVSQGVVPDPQVQTAQQLVQQQPDVSQATQQMSQQQTILPDAVPVTQDFNTYNPQDEVFSGGVSRGVNLGAKEGTKVALPPGNWQIVNQHDQATSGGVGESGGNVGYGNAILAQNLDTGDRLHFTHLSKVSTTLGQQLQGNSIIGETGATGNVTGPHLNLEYYRPDGNIGDPMQSPYSSYIMPQQGGASN